MRVVTNLQFEQLMDFWCGGGGEGFRLVPHLGALFKEIISIRIIPFSVYQSVISVPKIGRPNGVNEYNNTNRVSCNNELH